MTMLLTRKIFETNNILMYNIKKESESFLDVFLKLKDSYNFTVADFIVLLETHLLMKNYSNKKIKKFFDIINKNTQSYINNLIEVEKELVNTELGRKKEINELIKKEKELEKLDNEEENN